MPGRIRIAADARRRAPRWGTRKAQVAGVEMLLVATLGVALKLGGYVPLNAFTAAVIAILAAMGCLLVGWPDLLIGRVRPHGLPERQARNREAQVRALRAHFADDLTMPTGEDASTHDTDHPR